MSEPPLGPAAESEPEELVQQDNELSVKALDYSV